MFRDTQQYFKLCFTKMKHKIQTFYFTGFSTADTTWLPVHDNYKTLNLESQKTDKESHYNIYRELTGLRNSSETLKSGALKVDEKNDGSVLSVVREGKEDRIILLINFSSQSSQSVNIASYTPGATNAMIIVSSVGSGIHWG